MVVYLKNKLVNEELSKLLKLVRKRPGMFLRPVTAQSLQNFLSGCFSYISIKYEELGNFFECQSPSLYDWIAMKEGVRNSPDMGWVEAIMRNALSEEEGVERFFQHLDAYLERASIELQCKAIGKKAQENYLAQAFIDKTKTPIKVRIVSYDESVGGVFLQFFDADDQQINDERYCLNMNDAKQYLKDLDS